VVWPASGGSGWSLSAADKQHTRPLVHVKGELLVTTRRSLVAGALITTAFAATFVASSASSASASCARRNLTTGVVLTNTSSTPPGSTTTKPSGTTCNDLNLTHADDTSADNSDGYAGFLFHSSTGLWQVCDSGYHFTADFTASS